VSGPIVFISHNRVKNGKLEELKQYYRQVAEMTEANKPGTLAHIAYLDDQATELSIVHVFPDSEAMDRHMLGVDELARKAREFMDSVSLEIYGAPSEQVLNLMRQIIGPGVTLTLRPDHVGGYIRL
jgi:quinol monooxygenase YgiN